MKITDNLPLQSGTSSDGAKEKAEAAAFEAALKKAAESGDKDALKKVCEDFESIFVQMLFKNMRATVQEGGLFEKSQAQSIFEGMLDEELSKKIASGQGIGLSEVLYRQLEKAYGQKDEEKGLDLKG